VHAADDIVERRGAAQHEHLLRPIRDGQRLCLEADQQFEPVLILLPEFERARDVVSKRLA